MSSAGNDALCTAENRARRLIDLVYPDSEVKVSKGPFFLIIVTPKSDGQSRAIGGSYHQPSSWGQAEIDMRHSVIARLSQRGATMLDAEEARRWAEVLQKTIDDVCGRNGLLWKNLWYGG